MDYVVQWSSLLTGYGGQSSRMSFEYAKAIVDNDKEENCGLIESWVVYIDPRTNKTIYVYG